MDLNIELLAKKAIEAMNMRMYHIPFRDRCGSFLLAVVRFIRMQHRKCRVHTDELCGADGVFQGGIRRGA